MAYAYVKIYYKGTCFRKFGGNNRDVRELVAKYKKEISKDEIKNYRFEIHIKG